MKFDFIRIDDYPIGDPTFLQRADRQHYLSLLYKALNIFESRKVKYCLGVTPMLLENDDIKRLNDTVNVGQVVMHGFNHGWEYKPWANIVETWPYGGEFGMYANEKEVDKRYCYASDIMKEIKNYNPKIHIPPFNCYNQSFVNVFENHGGELILSCDKEHVNFNHSNIQHQKSHVNLSRWQISYADAPVIINMFREINLNKEHITLHWMYDCTRNNWEQYYNILCDGFLKKVNQ